ncbi:MAG: transcriptional repressor [Sporocytophaga sp.]|uniref:Fur family transcriptional regulator n=1 Tax=Sporocytophaga sp. TaxID=2231183 RepID=UPI001B03B830|nr:Fur family transcriptional regulator [Sporocytophaga sp.]MBO9699192.1 transcriptional repressor [Sporocytophaga sp.]
MEKSFSEIKELLIRKGLKATHQRIVIYHLLFNSFEHPTAELLFDKLKINNPSISLGTVYKTLDTFVQTGLAEKVLSETGSDRYDANLSSHHHIYYTDTKEIVDFYDSELQDLIIAFLNKKSIPNLKIKDFKIQIHGEKIDMVENQIN